MGNSGHKAKKGKAERVPEEKQAPMWRREEDLKRKSAELGKQETWRVPRLDKFTKETLLAHCRALSSPSSVHTINLWTGAAASEFGTLGTSLSLSPTTRLTLLDLRQAEVDEDACRAWGKALDHVQVRELKLIRWSAAGAAADPQTNASSDPLPGIMHVLRSAVIGKCAPATLHLEGCNLARGEFETLCFYLRANSSIVSLQLLNWHMPDDRSGARIDRDLALLCAALARHPKLQRLHLVIERGTHALSNQAYAVLQELQNARPDMALTVSRAKWEAKTSTWEPSPLFKQLFAALDGPFEAAAKAADAVLSSSDSSSTTSTGGAGSESKSTTTTGGSGGSGSGQAKRSSPALAAFLASAHNSDAAKEAERRSVALISLDIGQLRKRFVLADSDDSGSLDEKELAKLMTNCRIGKGDSKDGGEEGHKALFARLDRNGDGAIDLQEFLAEYVRVHLTTALFMLRREFNGWTAGTTETALSPKQVAAVFDKLIRSRKHSRRAVATLLSRLGKPADSSLTLEEIAGYVFEQLGADRDTSAGAAYRRRPPVDEALVAFANLLSGARALGDDIDSDDEAEFEDTETSAADSTGGGTKTEAGSSDSSSGSASAAKS